MLADVGDFLLQRTLINFKSYIEVEEHIEVEENNEVVKKINVK